MYQEPIVYIMPIVLLGFSGFIAYLMIKAGLPYKNKKK